MQSEFRGSAHETHFLLRNRNLLVTQKGQGRRSRPT